MTDSFLRRLETNCSNRSDKIAMRIVGDASEVYTFGEMMKAIRSAAGKIAECGIGIGERVALIGENHPSWAIAYLAIIYRGAVCVPLDPHGGIETLTNFIENSEARLAFIGPEVSTKFQQIQDRLERRITVVTWGAEGGDQSHEHLNNWSQHPSAADGSDSIGQAAGNDVALLIYTSGTTGTPKGVPLTHANIVAELD
ncbi:MAG: class I adenylate-forming enzyme family protein, partial [Acidobacteriota bacterium]